MTATPVRGSWTLDQALRVQWDAHKLDEVFKTAWPAPKRAIYPTALFDGEARPGCPYPYCVFEKGTAPLASQTGGMAGKPGTCIGTYDVPVQFTIHHTDKDLLIPFAKAVAAAFDQGNILQMSPDRHVDTWRTNDFGTKEEADHWNWVLEFRFQLEGDLPLPGVSPVP